MFVCNAKNNPLFLSLYTYDSEYFVFIMILSEKSILETCFLKENRRTVTINVSIRRRKRI